MRHRLFGWVLAIGLLILTVFVLMVVEGRGQDLDRQVYLPVVVRGFDPSVPTATLVPTPTTTPMPIATSTPVPCALFVKNLGFSGSFDALCYEVVNTGIGEKCSNEVTIYYGDFPSGIYEWCATGYVWWHGPPYDNLCQENIFGTGYTVHTFWSDFVEYPPTPLTP